MARLPGSAEAAPQPREPEEVKGPPLTNEEIIAAIGRDSHPPELDRFGDRISPES